MSLTSSTAEETRLITTVRAFPASWLDSDHKSFFSFYESPAGQPPASHKWFYEGDGYGWSFYHRGPDRGRAWQGW